MYEFAGATATFFKFLKQRELLGHFAQFGNLIKGLQYRVPHNAALSFLGPGQEVLDWSCGNGHFSLFLTMHQVNTTGFSFGQGCPAALRHNELFHYVAGDTAEPVHIPFDDNKFDLVFSIGVLEHVHETGGDQAASLAEIHRILKPGGHFL